MSILKTKISHFNSTKDVEVAGQITIGELLETIEDGTYSEKIEKIRGGDKSIKTYLPTFAAHGIFKHYRKKTNFIESSGIIILDIDDVELDEIEETKEDIMDSSDHILAVMTSPSGNGIKVLYYVEPDLITIDSYRKIGKEIVSNFEIYGNVDFLSITDCLIITSDEDILINEDAVPDRVMVKETAPIVVEIEELDETKTLWDDAEDFFETVLSESISEKTNNNFHFIQVAVFDLKKFGFEHPKDDLSFVIDYSEELFKRSSENKQRFLDAVEIAKEYPQLKWAYKTFDESDDFDDEYIDYSEFKESVLETPKSTLNEELDQSDDDEDYDGLIDYENLWERCLETMAEGDRVGYEVSLKNLADVLRFKGSGVITVTGIPGHGKTEFIDAILLDLARLYKHKSLIAGFEQEPEEHIIKLMRKMVGADIRCETYRNNKDNLLTIRKNYDFVTNHFRHINVNKTGGNINDILKYSAEIIRKERENGGDPKYMVLDPFNMLSIKGKFSGHEKIEEILRRITHFSHQMGILVFLVAHPFKMRVDEKTGQYQVPDFYSVKGSSAFFEMSYHGFVVYRNPDGTVLVKILKVKQNNLGTAGSEVMFVYNKLPGRYIPIDEEANEMSGDHREKNWLDKV